MSDTSVAVVRHRSTEARMMVQGAQVTAAGAADDGLLSGFATAMVEGVGALYSGIGAVCAGAAPAQALFFGGMTATKQAMGDFRRPTSTPRAVHAWVPMEVIKEKLMIEGQIKTKESLSRAIGDRTKLYSQWSWRSSRAATGTPITDAVLGRSAGRSRRRTLSSQGGHRPRADAARCRDDDRLFDGVPSRWQQRSDRPRS